jgi:hypothetical protein
MAIFFMECAPGISMMSARGIPPSGAQVNNARPAVAVAVLPFAPVSRHGRAEAKENRA